MGRFIDFRVEVLGRSDSGHMWGLDYYLAMLRVWGLEFMGFIGLIGV